MGEAKAKHAASEPQFRAGYYLVGGAIFFLSPDGIVQKTIVLRGGRERHPQTVDAVKQAAREVEEREVAELRRLMLRAGELPETEAVPTGEDWSGPTVEQRMDAERHAMKCGACNEPPGYVCPEGERLNELAAYGSPPESRPA